MRKYIAMVATILCISLLMISCKDGNVNDEPNSNESTDTQDEIESKKQMKLKVISPTVYSQVSSLNLEPGSIISIIGRYKDDSFWEQVELGASDAVDDLNELLGYTGNDKIQLVYSAPNIRDDVDEQINILDEELNRYPIAVGIAAIDTSACTLQFDLASENNIPIITFDSGSEYQRVAAHVSTDNFEAASTAASQLAYAIGQTGDVAVFVQDSVSMTARDRLRGFLDAMATKFPDVTVVHTYHLDDYETMAERIALEKNLELPEGEEEIDPATLTQEDIVNWILEKNPDIKGVFATNLDTTQLVANTLVNANRSDIKVVGFDGGEEQLEFLENGVIEGLVLQNPYGMGYATVVAAARVDLDLGNESKIDTGYVWVTKDNLEETAIANMLY